MKKMHETQVKILEIIKEYGNTPWTIRDLQERLNITSPSLIYHHLQMLSRKGFIRRNPESRTNYQLLSESDESIVYLNTYGMAQCGPDGRILSCEPMDKIPVSRKLLTFNVEKAFLMSAMGDSMEPRIYEGDYVIVERTECAENGDIVVCTYQEKVLIKMFNKYNNSIITLNSFNTAYSPIVVNEFDSFRVEGVVRGIISYSVKK